MTRTAIRLWADLDGYAVAHGLGYLQDLPLERFCNFVWWMLTKDAEKRDVEKLRAQLWQQPEGVPIDARSPWSPENELSSFRAFKAGLTGAVKPNAG